MDGGKDSILDQVAANGLILPKGPTNGFTRAYLEKNAQSSLFSKYLEKLKNNWDSNCAKETRLFAYMDHQKSKPDITGKKIS